MISNLEATEAGGVEAEPPQPRYKYLDEDGQHLHTLDGKPLIGTSTAVGVISKPLTWWASSMALTPLGWLHKKKSTAKERQRAAAEAIQTITLMSAEAFACKLDECYRAHDTRKKDTAVAGTDMHAELEKYVKACVYDNAGEPIEFVALDTWVGRFAEWSVDRVAEFVWSEGHCYSENLWTGGVCDCGAILNNGRLAVIDFKSSKEAWFSQWVQCGGYATQIMENGILTRGGARVIEPCNVDALIVFAFGGDDEPQIFYNVAAYSEAFKAAVTLHKLKQAFEGDKYK